MNLREVQSNHALQCSAPGYVPSNRKCSGFCVSDQIVTDAQDVNLFVSDWTQLYKC